MIDEKDIVPLSKACRKYVRTIITNTLRSIMRRSRLLVASSTSV